MDENLTLSTANQPQGPTKGPINGLLPAALSHVMRHEAVLLLC